METSSVKRAFILVLWIIGPLLFAGCATQTKKAPVDKSLLPRSIVVMPPLNRSIEVFAPYVFMASVSEPLAEKGYYVYPVAVVEQLMRKNGLPTPAEMNDIPLEKIRQFIGADAVLYTTINNWGQKYEVIQSKTIVSADLRLVNTQTGEQIWQGRAHATRSSGMSNQGILVSIIASAVEHIANTLDDQTFQLSQETNTSLLHGNAGLPDGPLRDETW